MNILRDSTVVDENTLIIVEADLHTDFAYLESLGIYRQLRSKEYKTNKHVFHGACVNMLRRMYGFHTFCAEESECNIIHDRQQYIRAALIRPPTAIWM